MKGWQTFSDKLYVLEKPIIEEVFITIESHVGQMQQNSNIG